MQNISDIFNLKQDICELSTELKNNLKTIENLLFELS